MVFQTLIYECRLHYPHGELAAQPHLLHKDANRKATHITTPLHAP